MLCWNLAGVPLCVGRTHLFRPLKYNVLTGLAVSFLALAAWLMELFDSSLRCSGSGVHPEKRSEFRVAAKHGFTVSFPCLEATALKIVELNISSFFLVQRMNSLSFEPWRV